MQPSREFDAHLAHVHFTRFAMDGSTEDLADALQMVAPELLRSAHALTRSAHDAADLVQDTFVAAIKSRRGFATSRPFVPWIVGIMQNLHRYRRRARARRLDPDRLMQADEHDPLVLVDHKLIHEQVVSAIAALPATYREVVALHLRDGLRPEEIAGVLDRRPGQVRTQLWRGLRQLRDRLPRGLAPMVAVIASVSMARAGMRAEIEGGGAPREMPTGGSFAGPAQGMRGILGARRILALAALAGCLACVLPLWSSWANGGPAGLGPVTVAALSRPVAAAERGVTQLDMMGALGRTVGVQPSGVGRVEVSLSWADTGLPAAGQSVRLHIGRRSEAPLLNTWFDAVREGWTDEHGNLAFVAVPVGPACLLFDDGMVQSAEFTVADDSVVERTEVLTPECEVEGAVVDVTGRPIAGAAIWMSSSGATDAPGYVAGYTAVDGSFALRAPHPKWLTWATAEGFARSAVFGETKDLRRVHPRLVLGPSPAGILGTVSTEDGLPSAGTLVGVFPMQRARFPLEARAVAPSFQRTDARGRFELSGLEPGPHHVVARGASTCAELTRVELRAGAQECVELHLRRGATLHGRAPAGLRPGAFVSAGPAAAVGQDTASMIDATARVMADGTYRVDHVVPGPVVLQLHGSPPLEAVAEVPQVDDGAVIRVDLQLRESDSTSLLRGRVVDGVGRPLEGIEVLGMPVEFDSTGMRDDYARAVTAADGRFRLTVRSGVPYRCLVQQHRGFVSSSSDPVVSGETEVLLTLGPTSAAIRGGFVRGAEVETDVDLVQLPLGHHQRLPLAVDGSFAIEQLPPGDYFLTFAKRPGRARPRLVTFHVDAGETRHLGWLADPGRGDLRVVLRSADGRPIQLAFTPLVTSVPRDVFVALVPEIRDGYADLRLAPDDYELLLAGVDFLPVRHRFSVTAGQRHEVGLDLVPARTCYFAFYLPPMAKRARLWLRIDDAAGNRIVDRAIPVPVEPCFRFALGLPAGPNKVRAVTASGLAAEGIVTVPDGASVGEAPLSFEARLR
ncbi:MAG: sigma-70 family RNA polymerase sigma factor [Planctomycetota bacterium]